jgi:hypothetical protein
MSYPTAKVHRVSRRKMGRGQYPAAMQVTVAVTASASTATLTFARPVVVTGTIPMTIAGKTLVSQTIVSPTVVTQLWSGALTGLAYAIPSMPANVMSYQGGQVVGTMGTFP